MFGRKPKKFYFKKCEGEGDVVNNGVSNDGIIGEFFAEVVNKDFYSLESFYLDDFAR